MTLLGISASQMAAFRHLQAINQQIAVIEKRASTGLNIATPAEKPAAWRQAYPIQSRIAALAAGGRQLDQALALVTRSASAMGDAKTGLRRIRSLLLQAATGRADPRLLQRQLTAEVANLRSLASTASVGGINLLVGAVGQVLLPGRTSASSLPSYQVSVGRSRTALFGGTSATGILEGVLDLSALSITRVDGPQTLGLSGPSTVVAGADSVSPGTGGLAGPASASVIGEASRPAQAASITLGTIDPALYSSGDTLRLDMEVNGTARTLDVSLHSVTDAASLQSRLQASFDAAFGADVARAFVTSGGHVSLQTISVGSTTSIAVRAITMADGDGILSSTSGMAAQQSFSSAQATIQGQLRTYDSLGVLDLTGLDDNDQLQLKIDARTGGAVHSGTLQVSLAGISDASSLASAINTAIANAGFYGAYAGASVVNGEVAIYLKASGEIRVSAVTAVDGDGKVPSATGLSAASAAGAAASAGRSSAAITGSDFVGPMTIAEGASIGFDLVLNTVSSSISVVQGDVDQALVSRAGYTLGSGTIRDAEELALVVEKAFARQGVSNVSVAVSGDRLMFARSGDPADGDTISIANVNATAAPARRATLVTGSDMASSISLELGQTISFGLSIDNGPDVRVTITRSTIEAALQSAPDYAPGTIKDADQLARVVRQALLDAGLDGIGVLASGRRLELTKLDPGSGSLRMSDVIWSEDSVLPAGTTILTLDLLSLEIEDLDEARRVAHLMALADGVGDLLEKVGAAEEHLEFIGSQLRAQTDFTQELEGVFRELFGGLVDVDLSAESVQLKALQVRRDLLKRSISIMNQSQLNILLLFDEWQGLGPSEL